MNFERIRRRVIRHSILWIAILTAFIVSRFIHVKYEYEISTFYDESMSVLYYIATFLQTGSSVYVVKQQNFLVIGLCQRYRHISNLMR